MCAQRATLGRQRHAAENGARYNLDEIRSLGRAAKDAGVRVHMDGARFASAVAALGCAPAGRR
ncbi:beta-eliminating lyase-related protein [Streptomyces sp. NPDC014006]|uniref:beta-eliminating lyase-related protein n=1 Tax=Streptomyces sp. NPDC014006 TaxID=3364870 RepID=UPI0036FBC9A1